MSEREAKMGVLERAIASVSPGWAARRAKNRLALNVYEAASRSNRTKNWRTRGGSIQSDTRRGLSVLRARSRELAQNNAYAEAAHREIPANIVGTGIIPTFTGRPEEVAKDWFDTKACDADGAMDFYGLQHLVARTVVESGECLVRRRKRRMADGLPVPLQIQVLEPDHLDTSKDGFVLSNGHRLIQGVEFDAVGKRVAYWLFRQHPGDGVLQFDAVDSVPVPASEVLHIRKVSRPGQVRGVPWSAPVLVRMRDFDEYEDAQLMKQKIAAAFAGFISEPDFVGAKSAPLDLPEKIEPGSLEILTGGREITFGTPPKVDGYAEYSSVTLHEIATGYGVPYSVLTGDLSKVNFSSGRMGDRAFNRNVKRWQQDILVSQMCRPVADWFFEAYELQFGAGVERTQQWTAPRRELTDPAREIPAIRDQIRSGLMTWAEGVREMGYDPDDFTTEAQFWNQVMDDKGLVFDSDPRKVSAAGLTQARAPGSELPDTEPSD